MQRYCEPKIGKLPNGAANAYFKIKIDEVWPVRAGTTRPKARNAQVRLCFHILIPGTYEKEKEYYTWWTYAVLCYRSDKTGKINIVVPTRKDTYAKEQGEVAHHGMTVCNTALKKRIIEVVTAHPLVQLYCLDRDGRGYSEVSQLSPTLESRASDSLPQDSNP